MASLPIATRYSLIPCSYPQHQYGLEPSVAKVTSVCGSLIYSSCSEECVGQEVRGVNTRGWQSKIGRSLFLAKITLCVVVMSPSATQVSHIARPPFSPPAADCVASRNAGTCSPETLRRSSHGLSGMRQTRQQYSTWLRS